VIPTPNERRVGEDRCAYYWLYVAMDSRKSPTLRQTADPARFPWHEVVEGAHYYLSVDGMARR
jgi:hypothetical protein